MFVHLLGKFIQECGDRDIRGKGEKGGYVTRAIITRDVDDTALSIIY